MIYRDGTQPTSSGSSVYYQSWSPSKREPIASIAIVHGFGEHAGLYQTVAEFFAGYGYAVFIIDLRGHGRSPGPRGHIQAWKDFREDVSALLDLARKICPRTPIFLAGNSLGGLIAIEYALEDSSALRGLIALSPALGKIGVARFLLLLSRLLSRIWPGFSLDTGLDSAAMTRDPAVAARLDADPLVHGRGSARLGTEVTSAIERVRRRAGELKLPLLLQHGDADTITNAKDSRWFYQQAGSPDKELKLYPGSYHNLCVDLNWREVLEDTDRWIRKISSR
jgi:alpha-beta hydrolase superfamily lysophospholipase